MNFTYADRTFLQPVSTAVLLAFAHLEIDIMELVLKELTGRGVDNAGTWIGFEAAEVLRRGNKVMATTKTDLESAFASIARDITIITWLMGINLALTAILLVGVFSS